VIPHIEQLVPVESGAVICSTIVALSGNHGERKGPGFQHVSEPGAVRLAAPPSSGPTRSAATREVSPHRTYGCEMAALAARRASRARLICRELSASR
jgi:hypothetical protein